jgi:hypothetical protein
MDKYYKVDVDQVSRSSRIFREIFVGGLDDNDFTEKELISGYQQVYPGCFINYKKLVDRLEVDPDGFYHKYLDRDDIEELGWEYHGKTQDLHFKLVKEIQPFNLTYRSFRLQYSLEDHMLRIIGFEYNSFGPEEEVLFSGTCNNYNELKFIMKRIGL